MTATPDELLTLALDVAREAAALVTEQRRTGVEVAATKSSPTDVVTEVDRAAEELIRARLLAARPDDGIIGEEGADTPSASGVTWVVDPIDGTVNFLYGIPQYAISIAARDGDQVVAGVVLDVTKGEAFTATRGGGAALDGRPIGVRDVVPLEQRLVITGFSYERATRIAQAAAVAAAARPGPRRAPPRLCRSRPVLRWPAAAPTATSRRVSTTGTWRPAA